MRTKWFTILAVLLATPCLSKVSVREYALPAVQGVPFRPIVCGDWALALLNTNPNNISSTIGVIAYDLRTKQVFTLHKGKADYPAITGSVAMWSGKIDDVPNLSGTVGKRGTWPSCLILYDLATTRYWAPVLKTNSAFVIAASGKYVAYELGCRINLYDIDTGAQMRISDDQARHRNPDIGGDLVVWQEYDSAFKSSRIRGYRISTGEELLFTESFAPIGAPNTDGEYVAWWDNAAGSSIYDTKTSRVRVIKSAVLADVSGGFAVYVKSVCACTPEQKASKRMLYGMDLKTGGEFQISKGEPDRHVRIEGSRVVWVEGSVLHYADLIRPNELQLQSK